MVAANKLIGRYFPETGKQEVVYWWRKQTDGMQLKFSDSISACLCLCALKGGNFRLWMITMGVRIVV